MQEFTGLFCKKSQATFTGVLGNKITYLYEVNYQHLKYNKLFRKIQSIIKKFPGDLHRHPGIINEYYDVNKFNTLNITNFSEIIQSNIKNSQETFTGIPGITTSKN